MKAGMSYLMPLIKYIYNFSIFPIKKQVCNFVGQYTIPFGFTLFWHVRDISSIFENTFLTKDHWWGFSARNAHMVHIVNKLRFKMV